MFNAIWLALVAVLVSFAVGCQRETLYINMEDYLPGYGEIYLFETFDDTYVFREAVRKDGEGLLVEVDLCAKERYLRIDICEAPENDYLLEDIYHYSYLLFAEERSIHISAPFGDSIMLKINSSGSINFETSLLVFDDLEGENRVPFNCRGSIDRSASDDDGRVEIDCHGQNKSGGGIQSFLRVFERGRGLVCEVAVHLVDGERRQLVTRKLVGIMGADGTLMETDIDRRCRVGAF